MNLLNDLKKSRKINLLIFEIENIQFAFPLEFVKEVVSSNVINPFNDGTTINLNKEEIKNFNLKHMLKLQMIDKRTILSKVVIITEFNGQKFSFLIDKVSQIKSMYTNFEHPELNLNFQVDFINCVIKNNENHIYVIDLKKFYKQILAA